MAQLENYDTASPIQIINGLVTTERSGLGKWGPQSRNGLYEFCRDMYGELNYHKACNDDAELTFIEIGAYAGESTIMFSMIADKVIAIDPWRNGYDDDDLSSHILPMEHVFESFLARTKCLDNRCKYKVAKDIEVIDSFKDNTVDAVYVDSIHKLGPCRDTINRWLPKICNNGYMCGHDFCGYWGEVVDAVLESIGVPDKVFKDGSWYKKIHK